jgi:hypothetical protein
LFAFEPVTSTKQISLPNTALNATAEMQPSADISQDLGPLAEQPIAVTDSSQYNLYLKRLNCRLSGVCLVSVWCLSVYKEFLPRNPT